MSSDQEFIRNMCIESYSQGQKTNGKYTLIKQNMRKVVPVPVCGVLVSGGQLPRLVGSNRAKMLWNLLALRQIAKRTISTASRRQFENKVPEKQKLFQEDNGMPVHLKGGIADALLYRATMILTVGGTAYAMYELAVASFPKKQD